MNFSLPKDFFHFPIFWYIRVPAWWLRFTKRLLNDLDNRFAVRLMARQWLTPVWQDRTFMGRILSFIFRSFFIFWGSLFMLLAFIAMIFWIMVWLVLPFILILDYPLFLIIFAAIWLSDFLIYTGRRFSDKTSGILSESQNQPEKLRELLLKNTDVKKILEYIEEINYPKIQNNFEFGSIVARAKQIQKEFSETELSATDLFIALSDNLKFHSHELRRAYGWIRQRQDYARIKWLWQDDYPVRPIGGVNRDYVGIVTPTLNKYATDLTKLAANGRIAETVGREKEIEQLVRVLGPGGRENVLLIGPPGCGKTAVVEGLANDIVQGTKHAGLRFRRLLALDIAALIAGKPEDVKERVVTIVNELKTAKNVILFVDEIHNLVEIGEDNAKSQVFAAFEPHLDAREFQFIGATSPVNYKKYIEPNEAFARTFIPVFMDPSDIEEGLKIVELRTLDLERKNKIRMTFKAIWSAVTLADRYIKDRCLPDSALDLIEDTINRSKNTGKNVISSSDVEEAVTEKTKIPVGTVKNANEKYLLLHLEEVLHQRIIGQDEAITNIADSLRRVRVGMAESGKLMASFLFAGATGVGKTETAKTLAANYFGSEEAMVRLDMSEYQTPDSINRLLGPPPGQPAYELGGQLTESVRHKPFTVILLDEIEKANPKILDVFLQLIDDARLTDGMGRTVDFSNTILIATSNVGTKILLDGVDQGKPFGELKTAVLQELRNNFRPEFLNRFTNTVIYQPLNQEQIVKIAYLMLTKIKDNLLKQDILVDFDPQLVQELARQGYNPLWGARELRRIIREEVEDKIAKKILENQIVPQGKYLVTREFLYQS